jgi:hypothetical protein
MVLFKCKLIIGRVVYMCAESLIIPNSSSFGQQKSLEFFSKAEKIVSCYNPYLSDDEKRKVKLDIVKIFNLIMDYNLEEDEILPDIYLLMLNKKHDFINDYYNDIQNRI